MIPTKKIRVLCVMLKPNKHRTYGNSALLCCSAQNVSRGIVHTTHSVLLGRLHFRSFGSYGETSRIASVSVNPKHLDKTHPLKNI